MRLNITLQMPALILKNLRQNLPKGATKVIIKQRRATVVANAECFLAASTAMLQSIRD